MYGFLTPFRGGHEIFIDAVSVGRYYVSFTLFRLENLKVEFTDC